MEKEEREKYEIKKRNLTISCQHLRLSQMWGGVEITIIDQRMNVNTDCPHRKLSTTMTRRTTERES